jgi:hypothetical protein
MVPQYYFDNWTRALIKLCVDQLLFEQISLYFFFAFLRFVFFFRIFFVKHDAAYLYLALKSLELRLEAIICFSFRLDDVIKRDIHQLRGGGGIWFHPHSRNVGLKWATNLIINFQKKFDPLPLKIFINPDLPPRFLARLMYVQRCTKDVKGG